MDQEVVLASAIAFLFRVLDSVPWRMRLRARGPRRAFRIVCCDERQGPSNEDAMVALASHQMAPGGRTLPLRFWDGLRTKVQPLVRDGVEEGKRSKSLVDVRNLTCGEARVLSFSGTG